MKIKFWQTQAFKDLEQKWYGKLEEKGFKDEEKTIRGDRVLRQRASNSYRGASQVEREAKLRYYEILQCYAGREIFENSVDKLVMERRSNGIKIKDISEELRNKKEKCHRETIRFIIRRYEIKWGLRKSK